jgi:hypothetical protein
MYRPLQQQYVRGVTIAARAVALAAIAAIHGARVDGLHLPIVSTQRLEEPTGPVQLQLRVPAPFQAASASSACCWRDRIYGVTAYAVTCRTREIGIRVAMGAQRGAIMRMVLRHGMALVSTGAALGLILAAATSRLLTRLLFGVPPIDPVTFGGAAVLFAAVGFVACYGPARRATRIDPLTALRYE